MTRHFLNPEHRSIGVKDKSKRVVFKQLQIETFIDGTRVVLKSTALNVMCCKRFSPLSFSLRRLGGTSKLNGCILDRIFTGET